MRYKRCCTLDNLISHWDGHASSEVGLAGVFGGSITTRRNLDDNSGASHQHYIRCEFGDWLANFLECKTAIAVILRHPVTTCTNSYARHMPGEEA